MKYKFNKDELSKIVASSYSYAGVCRAMGIVAAGGNFKTIKKKIKDWNLDTSHFTGKGWNVKLKFIPKPKIPLSLILIENSSYTNTSRLKSRLFKEGYKDKICECCELTEWQGEVIPLELHHLNGVTDDHRIENIQILCPNCHAQTDNYRGKNILSASIEK